MRLTCPNCGAQYEVARDAVPTEGRDVQCSNCGLTWLATPQPESEADTGAAAPSPRSTITPEIAEILRAEAEREAAARRRGGAAEPETAEAAADAPSVPFEADRETDTEQDDPAAVMEAEAGRDLREAGELPDEDDEDDPQAEAPHIAEGTKEGAPDNFDRHLDEVTEALRASDAPDDATPPEAEPRFDPFDEAEDEEEIDFAAVLSASASAAPVPSRIDSRDLWEEDDEIDLTQIAHEDLPDPTPAASRPDEAQERDAEGVDVGEEDDDIGEADASDDPVPDDLMEQGEPGLRDEPVVVRGEALGGPDEDDEDSEHGFERERGYEHEFNDEDGYEDEGDEDDRANEEEEDLADPILMASLSAEDLEEVGASDPHRPDLPLQGDVAHGAFDDEDRENHGDLADTAEAPTPPAPVTAHETARERASMAAASTGAVTRRDLLPDIEEINSSLRSTAMRSGPPRSTENTDVQRGRGFRLGFGTVLLIAVGLALIYGHAGRIGAALPPLEGPLESYAMAVDGLRGRLDTWLRGLLDTIG